jgi:hypothetical protein
LRWGRVTYVMSHACHSNVSQCAKPLIMSRKQFGFDG